MLRIAHPMNPGSQAQPCCRCNQVLMQFGRSLFIAPVADPYQIASLEIAQRLKHGRVRRLVPGEHALCETAFQIDLAQRPTEHQCGIEAVKVSLVDLVRRGDGAMMGVMEEETERSSVDAALSQFIDQPFRRPLVDDDGVRLIERFIEVERELEIAADIDVRDSFPCFDQRVLAAVLDGIEPAPAVVGLIDRDAMAHRGQFARDPTQEMSVAVIPAGRYRMAEEDDVHARASRPTAWASRPSKES